MRAAILFIFGVMLFLCACVSSTSKKNTAEVQINSSVEQTDFSDGNEDLFEKNHVAAIEIEKKEYVKPDKKLIREVQSLLQRHNYRVGPIDGIAGKKTTSAIERFQKNNGLTINGRVTISLRNYLKEKPIEKRQKSTNKAVKTVLHKRHKPGEKLISPLKQVSEKYKCNQNLHSILYIETNQIIPQVIYAGEEINHYFIYVMCPIELSQVINGKLTRAIYHNSQLIFEDAITHFEFKPGKWGVDAFIEVPLNTESGNYLLELAFFSKEHSFVERSKFLVKAKVE